MLSSCVPVYTDHMTLKTNSLTIKTGETHIKHLFLFAKGNISSRLVTSNFHSVLNKIITRNGGTSDFNFQDITQKDKQSEEININTHEYDGFFFFYQRTPRI